MKIVFATDGSPAALAALRALVARYDWFREPPALTLLHVHPPIPYGLAARWVGKQAITDYFSEESAKALASGVALLDQQHVAHQTAARVGEPAHEIVAFAREGGFDCIALGTQGHTALASLMLGSVAQKVLTTATLPVLLLR
jgi:nucleotide-binding universal stress UspA family protein